MFVRVTRGTADPAKWDDLVALTEDFAAVFKQMPGFVSYQGGGDRRTGAFVSNLPFFSKAGPQGPALLLELNL